MGDSIRVLVTGAAGQIAYSLIKSLANGEVFGPDKPVTIVMLDIPMMQSQLDGLEMELQDCNFKALKGVEKHTVAGPDAFKDIDYALLVGAMPRKEGMERKDLLKANVQIFKTQGECINKYAKKDIKVVVVGNPANTNAYICSKYADSIPKENFSALTRLDQNRAQFQIASKIGNVKASDVKNVIIWGNHSSTQFPDTRYGKVMVQGKEVDVAGAVKDDSWLKKEFVETVQQRGAAVIKARKLSSAMSAANAIVDHVRDWYQGKSDPERYTSMAVKSTGAYDIPEGLVYSFPVRFTKSGCYEIVTGLQIDDYQREKMDITKKELEEEKNLAESICEGM